MGDVVRRHDGKRFSVTDEQATKLLATGKYEPVDATPPGDDEETEFPGPPPAPPEDSKTGALEAFGRGLVRGGSFGFDRLTAAMAPGPEETYVGSRGVGATDVIPPEQLQQEAAAAWSADSEKAAADSPKSFIGGQVLGTAAGTVPLIPYGVAAQEAALARFAIPGMAHGTGALVGSGAVGAGVAGAMEGAVWGTSDAQVQGMGPADTVMNAAGEAGQQGLLSMAMDVPVGGTIWLAQKYRNMIRANPDMAALEAGGGGTSVLGSHGIKDSPAGVAERAARMKEHFAGDVPGANLTDVRPVARKGAEELAPAVVAQLRREGAAFDAATAAESKGFYASPLGRTQRNSASIVDALDALIAEKQKVVAGSTRDLANNSTKELAKIRDDLLGPPTHLANGTPISEAQDTILQLDKVIAAVQDPAIVAPVIAEKIALQKAIAEAPPGDPIDLDAREFDVVLGGLDRSINYDSSKNNLDPSMERLGAELRGFRTEQWGPEWARTKEAQHERFVEIRDRGELLGVGDPTAIHGTVPRTKIRNVADTLVQAGPEATAIVKRMDDFVRNYPGPESDELLRLANLPRTQQPAWFREAANLLPRPNGNIAPFEGKLRGEVMAPAAYDRLRGTSGPANTVAALQGAVGGTVGIWENAMNRVDPIFGLVTRLGKRRIRSNLDVTGAAIVGDSVGSAAEQAEATLSESIPQSMIDYLKVWKRSQENENAR